MKTLEPYLLAGLLIAFVVGIAAAVLLLWWRYSPKPHKPTIRNDHRLDDRPDWPLGIGIVVLILAGFSWLDSRDAKIIAELEAQGQIRKLMAAGYLRPDKAWFKANLNDCPPRTDGMTDQVVMVITTEADGKHKSEGCSRIAQRQYIVKPKAKRVQG